MNKKDQLIISAYGSHNAAIAMYYKNQYYVVEVERWLNSKNIGLTNYMPCKNPALVTDQIIDWLLSKTDKTNIDMLLTDYFDVKLQVPVGATQTYDHHMAHAACTFYQSPYDNALVFTFDGGGDGGYFNVYTASRNDGIKLIDKFNQDLGFPYMILAEYLEDIKKESLSIGNLVYAGKLMGLCSYGKIHDEWVSYFDEFYDKFNYMGNSYIGGAEARYEAITLLMSQIGIVDFDFETTRIKGQLAWDIAATSQKAFENQFFKYAREHLDEYKNVPVCLAGGCALNVLLNTKLLKERNGAVFIPPNTNDCGIAIGGLLGYLEPGNQVDLTYSGLPMMDITELGFMLEDRNFSTISDVTMKQLASFIADGNIVGFIQGNSEHGSRALGNRSILCNPVGDMKNVLNEKVKHREWYRPFAPLVKATNVHEYFNFYGDECRHMTFVADVKPEWQEKLPAITHEDGTGRLQTVTQWQNPAIFELLTEFEKSAGHGVLLNTSFNDNGKPILTRFSDALNLLATTKLDAVYYHEKSLLIFKNGDETKLSNSDEMAGISKLKKETTLNLYAFPESDDECKKYYAYMINILSKNIDNVVVITSKEYEQKLQSLLVNKNTKLYVIDTNRHYYNAMVTKHGVGNDKEKTAYFSKYICPLWAKEVIRDNLFSTKYHTFVDLREAKKYKYSDTLIRDIIVLSKFGQTDDNVIITSAIKNKKDCVFTKTFLENKFKCIPEAYPLHIIMSGNTESIVWFSNNYEGMLLWFMQQGKVNDMSDYMLISYAENKHMYKFLEI